MATGFSRGSTGLSQASPARSVSSPWVDAGRVGLSGDFDELASVEVAYLARLATPARVVPPSLTSFLR
jgi:hypothetical protein